MSYTQTDQAWAEWIGWKLEEVGHRVLLQAWDFLPGSNWMHAMQEGVTRSARTIAVLSPAYLRSAYGSLEWYAALAADPTGENGTLLPVRVEKCGDTGLLRTVTYVDLVGVAEDEAEARLLRSVRQVLSGRGKPSEPPPWPRSGRTAEFPGSSADAADGAGSLLRGNSRTGERDHSAGLGVVSLRDLRDRAGELAELAAFCAGDEPYVRWVGPPWSGKTALLAAFASRPPAGVDLVSFFVVARWVEQCDSNAFVASVLSQLCALTGEEIPARLRHDRTLVPGMLERARHQSRQAGRRLVILVDGLDEDQSNATGLQLPSIASLLPADAGEGLQVIVSSRPDPPLSGDVAASHPLRRSRTRRLKPSPAATDTERLAGQELRQILTGGPAFRDILGLILASGGSLTLNDLEQLTGLATIDLGPLANGTFGRAFTGRPERRSGRTAYSVAHETLRVTALEQLGGKELDKCRRRIHRWARSFRTWPDHTPAYLINAYPSLLLAEKKRKQLVRLAGDPERHRWLLAATGGDAQAFEEIRAVREVLLADPDPDLDALAILGIRYRRLHGRNWSIPVELPLLWARLGEFDRAEALAGGLSGYPGGDPVLIQIAEIALTAGHPDRAADLIAAVKNRVAANTASRMHGDALAVLAARAGNVTLAAELANHPAAGSIVRRKIVRALMDDGGLDRAEEFIATCGELDRDDLRRVLFDVVVEVDRPAAVRVARTGQGSSWTLDAWKKLIPELVRAGAADEAEHLVDSVRSAGGARGALVGALAAVGDRGGAGRVAAKVDSLDTHASAVVVAVTDGREAALRYVTRLHPMQRQSTLIELVGVGPPEDQAAFADAALSALRPENPSGSTRPWECQALVEATLAAGLLDTAEAAARCISPVESQVGPLLAVAEAWAARGMRDNCVRVARAAGRIGGAADYHLVRAWTLVANQYAESGEWASAEAALSEIRERGSLSSAAGQAVEVMARRGRVREVEGFVGACDRSVRSGVIDGVLRGLVAGGWYEDAERWATGTDNYFERKMQLARLVALLIDAGERARSERLLGHLSSAARPRAFAGLAELCRADGETAEAMRWASKAEAVARARSPLGRGAELYELCVAFLGIGDLVGAMGVATRISHPLTGSRRLACEILLACRTGDVDRVLLLLPESDRVLEQAQLDPDFELSAGVVEAAAALAGALGQGFRLAIEAGRQAEAEAALESLRDVDLRSWVSRMMIDEAARAGAFERAETLAASAGNDAARVRAITDIVDAAVDMGATAAAERLARTTTADCRTAGPLVRLAVSTARHGDRSRSAILVREAEVAIARYGLPLDWLKPETLAVAYAILGRDDAADAAAAGAKPYIAEVRRSLMGEYVRLGRFDRARSLVEISDRAGDGTLRPAAVRAFASAGRFDLVEWVAALPAQAATEDDVLGALAEVYAMPETLDRLRTIAARAEQFADRAQDYVNRKFLLQVADGLATAGDMGYARRLLARYLRDGYWTDRLDVIGRISPATLRTMAEAV